MSRWQQAVVIVLVAAVVFGIQTVANSGSHRLHNNAQHLRDVTDCSEAAANGGMPYDQCMQWQQYTDRLEGGLK